ncbi:hypothetical protein IKF27_01460 [Candidatus Saccharibacteria bacterium]|nr:hypothetical protein [Candidatus Saccharibacteria bacterium]
MSVKHLNGADKRCRRTRAALEDALYNFYGGHSHFERLPVVRLCKAARVSTPTFYRHYRGVHSVVLGKDYKINLRLRRRVGEDVRLMVGLIRAFCFVGENNRYYTINLLRCYERPFLSFTTVMEPKILDFVKIERGSRRARKVDQRICAEIKTYLIFELKLWIKNDDCDSEKIDSHVQEVLFYSRCRIQEMEKKLSREAIL